MPARLDLANAIRALAMDAVQQANSGHPGMPMGMADIAEVLWNDHLKHNPSNPNWFDRDRFVVSNGHGSMLLYGLLHLAGYELPMQELKNFRQLHSKTPGHPENHLTPGVETTTGPLGQGIANAVGMALAEQLLARQYNRDGHQIIDHQTYVFTGDGCLMEGISHEACSLAGTLGLGKLVVFYDDNDISIDGEVDGWFRDDTPARFEAYGWQVVRNVNGHDAEEIQQAIETAREERDRPTLICCKTLIGWGSPNKQGKEESHGAPLGADEIALVRKTIGWPHAPFEIPAEIYAGWDAKASGAQAEQAWDQRFAAYADAHPELAAELRRRISGELPQSWESQITTLLAESAGNEKSVATRKASQMVLNKIAPSLPEFLGGSADLTGSNLTAWEGCKWVTPDDVSGNYVSWGVREFAMTAAQNGLALHGGFIPFGGTFLTFSDYARNAVRMAALMQIRNILVYSHDSIGLGEDGPTHQSIEHVASLRLIPNLDVWRPGDLFETAVAWQMAVERADGPSALCLSRQNTDQQPHSAEQAEDVRRGAYVVLEAEGTPEAIVIATGSEVGLAVNAAKASGKAVRVVSMPCADRFLAQDQDYRDRILPPAVTRRLAIEAGVSDYWWRFVGLQGDVLGIDRYGESAPAGDVFKYFGFTVDNAVKRIEGLF